MSPDLVDEPLAESALKLSIPENDAEDPELSVVIPALNEQLTVTEFVDWCHQGFAEAGVSGEVLIADSSTDATPELALQAGARVLHMPKRGIGSAYGEAIPYTRGRYVMMGDADCTYDFRCLKPFVDSFHEGYEFVMGSRWTGGIERGSMPWLHQYFGTPVATWLLNRLYSTKFTDIHCGMRGVTRERLMAMDMHSAKWDYSSEMIAKAVHMGLRTTEVPVPLLKDRNGRVSHHKRRGWFSPFQAAWLSQRSLFMYAPDYFLLKPGFVAFILGLLVTLPLNAGRIAIGSLNFNLYWMLFGMALTIIGLQSFLLGCIAQVLFDYTGRARRRWLRLFSYTRSMVAAACAFVIGLGCLAPILVYYIAHGDLGSGNTVEDHLGVTGLMMVMIGFSLFVSTLVLHTAAMTTRGSVLHDQS
jgi:glycosyltransferase involved in cell wall biosynthesis